MSPKEMKYGKFIANKIFFVKQLDYLGIQKKYLGYYTLVELMDVLINNCLEFKSFSTDVYPYIANKYGKTVCTIERNIRNLIKQCWCFDLMEKLNCYYAENDKPTCREFVYLVKDYILKQIS